MNRKLIVSALVVSGFGVLLALAQNRASMDSPVIKLESDVVTFSTRFQDFSPGGDYRIGVGTESLELAGLKIEIADENANVISPPLIDFTQGYTSSWWSVDEVKAKGYVFEKSALDGKVVVLTVSVPRGTADAAERIFVFVAKKYGPTTWYLEDGTELTKSHW